MNNKAKILKQVMADPRYKQAYSRCIVCNHEANHAGVFFPNNPKEFGALEGETRFFIYGLCQECKETTEHKTIENFILKRVVNGINTRH